MARTFRFSRPAALLVAVISMPLLAAPADQVRARVSGFRALGAAYKSVNDTLRSGQAPPNVMQAAARQFLTVARAQYGWFPAGSGPTSGARTAARPEIWTRAREFRLAQDGLARQAQAFQTAVSSGDVNLMKTEARRLGAACKACHDTFRMERD